MRGRRKGLAEPPLRSYPRRVTTPEDPYRTAPPPPRPAASPWGPGYGTGYGYGAPQGFGPPPAPIYGPPPLPGYQQPGGLPYPPAETDTKAIVALALSIGAWTVLPLVLAIVALVLASSSQRDIDSSAGRLTGESLLTATRWVAWVNIGMCGLVVLAFVGFGLLLAVTGFS